MEPAENPIKPAKFCIHLPLSVGTVLGCHLWGRRYRWVGWCTWCLCRWRPSQKQRYLIFSLNPRRSAGTKQIMAGSPIKRARIESGLITSGEAILQGKAKLAGWLPELLDKTHELAMGIQVEGKDKSGQAIVYKQPPMFIALCYLIDRVLGKPATETDEVSQRLNLARAMFIEQQIASGFIDAQVKDLSARGERAMLEVQMWPQQFVTEDEQRRQLQALAAAANRALLSLTPEAFAQIISEKDPAEALEALKGVLGRDQAAILEDVMTGGKDVATDEEEDADG